MRRLSWLPLLVACSSAPMPEPEPARARPNELQARLQVNPIPPALAARGELRLIADDSHGLRVRLVNSTSLDWEMATWDGRPLLSLEAMDESGSWRRVNPVAAKCGSSLGTARLAASYECSFSWEMPGGPVQTRLRFRMDLGRDCMITSNEFDGGIPRRPSTLRIIAYWIGRLEDHRQRAQSELLEIGEPAAPALREVLRTGSPQARKAAEEVLSAMAPPSLAELEEVLNRPLPMGGWFVDGPFFDGLRRGLAGPPTSRGVARVRTWVRSDRIEIRERSSHCFVRIEGRFDLREARWNESERRIEALLDVAPPWADLRLLAREEFAKAVLFTFSRDRRERTVRYVLITSGFALLCITDP